MFGEVGAKTGTGGEWSKKMPGALTLPWWCPPPPPPPAPTPGPVPGGAPKEDTVAVLWRCPVTPGAGGAGGEGRGCLPHCGTSRDMGPGVPSTSHNGPCGGRPNGATAHKMIALRRVTV